MMSGNCNNICGRLNRPHFKIINGERVPFPIPIPIPIPPVGCINQYTSIDSIVIEEGIFTKRQNYTNDCNVGILLPGIVSGSLSSVHIIIGDLNINSVVPILEFNGNYYGSMGITGFTIFVDLIDVTDVMNGTGTLQVSIVVT